jgi:hypothetical protein
MLLFWLGLDKILALVAPNWSSPRRVLMNGILATKNSEKGLVYEFYDSRREAEN